MSALLDKPSQFASLVERFFVDRLMSQKDASPRTVESYRDTFRMIFRYAEQQLRKSPMQLTLNDFNAKLILGFLNHLEKDRHNCIRSRNARLAALHSFSRYVSMQCPPAMYLARQILDIPMKRFEKPLLVFLSREEIAALLAAPGTHSWFDRRDRLLLAMLYNTGARISELIGIRVADVTFGASSYVRLRGKGRKLRSVPLWKETAEQVRQWLKSHDLQPDQPLLPNRYGHAMTRANAADRFALALAKAAKQCPQLRERHISPHSVRHTVAQHLLRQGVDITVIAMWLGHECLSSTHGYIEADLAMKERALSAIRPPATKGTRYNPSDSLLTFLQNL
jgi:site-specific recombinase XerD